MDEQNTSGNERFYNDIQGEAKEFQNARSVGFLIDWGIQLADEVVEPDKQYTHWSSLPLRGNEGSDLFLQLENEPNGQTNLLICPTKTPAGPQDRRVAFSFDAKGQLFDHTRLDSQGQPTPVLDYQSHSARDFANMLQVIEIDRRGESANKISHAAWGEYGLES